jgi:erythromycin esterase-like protein
MRASLQRKLDVIGRHALPLLSSTTADTTRAYDRLLQAIGDAPVVMIGEASHGTLDFYRERANITRRLIEEKGFSSVIVEADWPDAYRINRFVQHYPGTKDKTAHDALGDFERFPTWMWRNTVVREFVEWMREHNTNLDPRQRVGFYGMDLYSFITSSYEVLQYLEKVDPKLAEEARDNYECFLQYGDDPRAYARHTAFGMSPSCEREVVETLKKVREAVYERMRTDGFLQLDEDFYAHQNAEIVKDAEEYYRASAVGRADSWNVRDTHMVKAIRELIGHRTKQTGRPAKVVIWAHNSHLGDARATDMGRKRGKHNVGQLLREQCGMNNTFNIGFTTYTGTVSAASGWGKPMQKKNVVPGRKDSWEGVLHEARPNGWRDFMLIFNQVRTVTDSETRLGQWSHVLQGDLRKHEIEPTLTRNLGEELLERYIGVIYRPDSELVSHYSSSALSLQYDAVIHIDETQALPPIDPHHHFPATSSSSSSSSHA